MQKVMTAAFALSALFAASPKAHAEVNYPWCLMGDTRGYECVFSSREQCAQDGRNRGFGSQCMPNPFYKPGAPTVSGPVNKRTVSQTARPPQTTNSSRTGRVSGPPGYCWAGHCYKTWSDCVREEHVPASTSAGCSGVPACNPAASGLHNLLC
jgi:Protein of unknown function (DUF3551)